MHRFFVPEQSGDAVRFPAATLHQMRRVLRLRPGDRVIAVLPGGEELLVELRGEADGGLSGAVCARRRPNREPATPITLVQGLARGERMDWIVQKGTELGMTRFQPVTAARSVLHLDGERAESRRRRWEAIAREAAEQSQRALIPAIEPIRPFRHALTPPGRDELLLIPWEGEREVGLHHLLSSHGESARFRVCIGPEGGWTAEEVALARRAGAFPVTLGPRILRTETAALAVLTAILYHRGGFGFPAGGEGEEWSP